MRRSSAATLLGLAALIAAAAAPDPTLDPLFADLRAATDPGQAALLERRIEAIWARQGSAAVHLLADRARRDLVAGSAEAALAGLTDALILDADPAALWQLRAEARARLGDDAGAITDLHAALAREPRQFEALKLLSRLAERRGDSAGALAAWRAVLALDPSTPDAQSRRHTLERRLQRESL